MKKVFLLFLVFFNIGVVYAQQNFIVNNDSFSQSKLILKKKKTTISLDRYLYLVKQNPDLLKKWIKDKTKILYRIKKTAYKPYSSEEIENWLNKAVKNENFQKAFYYLFIDRNIFKTKSKFIQLPNFKEGFKYLSKAILETKNPIISYIGSDLLYYGFNNYNNPVFNKYAHLFSEPLYQTGKSCLGFYIYGKSFLSLPYQNFNKAHEILLNGYKKCASLEKRNDFSRTVAVDLRYESARTKALLNMTKNR